MRHLGRWNAPAVAGIFAALLPWPGVSRATAGVAQTPPMGWNRYDACGTTITERQFRANLLWMSGHLRRFGRYTPAPNRFPSAAQGAGVAPLARYVHSLGLNFGIHILRGIPQQAVREDLPIAGSAFRARQAAAPGVADKSGKFSRGFREN